MERRKTVSGNSLSAYAYGALFVLVSAIAVLMSWGLGDGSRVVAQEPTAGMSLGTEGISCDDSECRVPPNSPFRLIISADPPPDVDFSGFAAEVFFDGLVWTKRSACASEVRVLRVDGDPPAICTAAGGPVGQARFLMGTSVPPPLPLIPFEALSSGDTLIEMDVACPADGTYDVALTAVSADVETQAAFGAVYFASDTGIIFVETAGTREIDLSGQGPESVAVADTLTITCTEDAPPPDPLDTREPPENGSTGGETPPATLDSDAAAAATEEAISAETEAAQTAEGTPVSAADATSTAVAAATAEAAAIATAEAGGVGNGGGDDDDDGGGLSTFVWVIIGVAVAAGVGGLGIFGWRWYARRAQSGESGESGDTGDTGDTD